MNDNKFSMSKDSPMSFNISDERSFLNLSTAIKKPVRGIYSMVNDTNWRRMNLGSYKLNDVK